MTTLPELDDEMTSQERVEQMRRTIDAQREHLERMEEEASQAESLLVLESPEFRDLDIEDWVLEELGVEDRSEIDPTDVRVCEYWDCDESPVGWCVYLRGLDDDCIFCGAPEERK